jgi:hypothetical protein
VDQHPGQPDPPPRRGGTTLALVVLVAAVALAGVALAGATDRLDTALLFVGVPCALALGIALVPRQGGAGATAFQATTVVLLLASALLHEGALCVLIASPLVYGTVGLVLGLVHLVRRGSTRHLAAAPVLAVVLLEGSVPGVRVHPEQQAEASRVVAADCADFVAALDRGPRMAEADRGRLLTWAKYPTPVAATGSGLEVGDTWELAMPAGAIATEVVERTTYRVDFAVTADTARTTRWVVLRTGSVRWAQTDGGCRATLRVDYTRKLDPSFWFGPVTDLFMNAGAATLLNALD